MVIKATWGLKAQARSKKRLEYFRSYTKKYRATKTAWQKRKRLYIIELLGGKCVSCGYSNPLALQIDHIHGGGHKELRALGSNYSINHIKDNLKTNKYQILCANCNWIKRIQNNSLQKGSDKKMNDEIKEEVTEEVKNGETQEETTETPVESSETPSEETEAQSE